MKINRKQVSIYVHNRRKEAKMILKNPLDVAKDVELLLITEEDGDFKYQDSNFFTALLGLRSLLEPHNIVISINGCRFDFFCSNMSMQMTYGEVGYILEIGKKGTKRISTFDKCDDETKLATIEEQKNYYEKWKNSSKSN